MPRVTLERSDLAAIANALEDAADTRIRSAFRHDLISADAADGFAQDDRKAASYLRTLAKRLRSYST